MTAHRRIATPFFEIGPKTFLTRRELLEVALAAARAGQRHQVDVILTPPALDIEIVKAAAPDLWIFAQTVDTARPGRSTGAITPEALRAAGADGVMLNHAERPLPNDRIHLALNRAAEAGLRTMICVDGLHEAQLFARHHPDIILAEPHRLIGTAHDNERPWIPVINDAVASTSPRTLVLHAGGVSNATDVTRLIAQGAAGTGCTTAIVAASDRANAVETMIRAVREAWDAREPQAKAETDTERTTIPR